MRQEAATTRDQQPIVEACLFCGWRYTGTTLAGRDAARTHREQEHPEAVQRKTYRKPRGYRLRGPVDQDVIEESRRVRAERELAEMLATVERGRIRRAAA
jgi:hypothetical protein